MADQEKRPATVGKSVQTISDPVADIDTLERVKHHRTIVNAWKQQQEQDRKMRGMYATWLMRVTTGQIIGINIIFVLIGLGFLKYDPWAANTFVMAVFAETSVMAVLVVKYLFPATSDKTRDLIDRFRVKDQD